MYNIPDITGMTQHPGFDCCLNPFVLQIVLTSDKTVVLSRPADMIMFKAEIIMHLSFTVIASCNYGTRIKVIIVSLH